VREALFGETEIIRDERELCRRFETERLSLEAGAEVVLTGRIEIGEQVAFRGRCVLGHGTSVDSGSILTDAVLGEGNRVRAYSLLSSVTAGDRNLLGPFCFLRDDCRIADDCILGAHVEAARSSFASGVKISHRAFIGDAVVGAGAIIGAGVVFCNWDGTGRQPTQIEPGAIIGSGSLLIPPLTIGEEAIVGAGSIITHNIAPGAKIIQRRS
jgi:bifunctional UDP-N-acetylglucosamine pyrophosphorylase/glucosamine-1-phosphate N-acetyltransferase